MRRLGAIYDVTDADQQKKKLVIVWKGKEEKKVSCKKGQMYCVKIKKKGIV